MIKIKQSKTADTRSCDFTKVNKQTLIESSKQHISDVEQALAMFCDKLKEAGSKHDADKLSNIDQFHNDFTGGFKSTIWWDNHRKINRHHLLQTDGIPLDVTLIDVLEFIADCVMAGMARTGSVYPINLDEALLKLAFNNTVELLKTEVVVIEPSSEASLKGIGSETQSMG